MLLNCGRDGHGEEWAIPKNGRPREQARQGSGTRRAGSGGTLWLGVAGWGPDLRMGWKGCGSVGRGSEVGLAEPGGAGSEDGLGACFWGGGAGAGSLLGSVSGPSVAGGAHQEEVAVLGGAVLGGQLLDLALLDQLVGRVDDVFLTPQALIHFQELVHLLLQETRVWQLRGTGTRGLRGAAGDLEVS